MISVLLLGACKGEPSSPTAATKEAAPQAAPEAVPPTAIEPAVLAAKVDPTPCGMIDATQVQALLGLPSPPETTSATATAPPRTHCRYGWADGQTQHYIEVAWAHALAGKPDKIAEGLRLTRDDIAEKRLQSIALPGVALASWGEGWLTVYPNDAQLFWVIMDEAGKRPREAKNLAAAIASKILHAP